MSMIALVTDLHFGARNDNEAVYKNQKKFFDEMFFPTLEAWGVKTIINLGDTFDKRKVQNTLTLHRSRKDIFEKMNNYDCHFIIGNHDVYFKSQNSVNSVSECLSDFTNIKVYDSPKTINIDGLNICIIPWINSENSDETFKEIEKTKARICMGHLELTGFEFHKGSICRHGLNKEKFTSKFIKTLSGHFHKRTVEKDLVYLGTAYQTTWNEFGEIKGFHLFNTETFELLFIENPFDLFTEFIYPNIEDCQDKFVRVVVTEEQSKTIEFQNYMNKIYDMKPVQVNTKLTDLTKIDRDKVENTIEIKNLDILDISKKYINSLENFSNKKLLEEEFTKIYNSVCL